MSNPDTTTAEAKQELLEKLGSHLPQRFPEFFELDESNNKVFNKVTKKEITLDRNSPEDPLARAGKQISLEFGSHNKYQLIYFLWHLAQLTQEDWMILEWDNDLDSYKLTTGLVCFPLNFSLQKKWNKSVSMIHEPVKGFTKHLSKNVQSLFKVWPFKYCAILKPRVLTSSKF